jgi:flagellin
MRINHNIAALNTFNKLSANEAKSNNSLGKLSSGLAINKAADNAAGLAISEKMRSQIRGLDQASKNSQDGISMLQTAEGALNETTSILQRMRELAVQAGNDTLAAEDRTAIKSEIDQLSAEVAGISERTQFNGANLIDGSLDTTGAGVTLQIGANSGQTLVLNIEDMSDVALGLTTTAAGDNILVDSAANAALAITAIDTAIETVSGERAKIGASQNRLEHTINNLSTASENMTSSESQIRDVDMAKEMTEFTKTNILSQAATAMLAQANQQPQNVLSLLK